MANVITYQLLSDGPRNVVVKITGVIDTADVAATGNIGASGFTTTIGSKSITFVAGALVPTRGQYITFGDSTTTFPTGTYITGVTSATVITVNNVALATNAAAAITITGTAGAIVIVDPAELSVIDPAYRRVASSLIIKEIKNNIEDSLSVKLFWEATTNALIEEIVGTHERDYKGFGGLYSNAGAGVTGKIVMTTQGWAASGILSFSLILEMVKN